MAVTTFIPEVWAAALLTTLEEHHVFAQDGVTNSDYEGEIAEQGDIVHIGKLTDPTIASYTRNSTDLSSPEVLATTDNTLTIDQAKYFNFLLDDLDAAQVKSEGDLVSKAAMRAAIGLRDAVDTYLSYQMINNTQAANVLAPVDADAPDEAFQIIRRLRMTLNKANVPSSDRFLIIAPEFEVLLLGDNRFIDTSRYGSDAPILTGEIGRALGFRILLSNNIPAGYPASSGETSNWVIAGHPMATTYAEQIPINNVEALRSQKAFADIVRGLHLYGSAVVRPEALAICDVDVTINSSS